MLKKLVTSSLLVFLMAGFGLSQAEEPILIVDEVLKTKLHGQVTDAKGKPVEGAMLVWDTIRAERRTDSANSN